MLTHLECSAPCGASAYDASRIQHLCTCGAPLFARYDIDTLKRQWDRDTLAHRPPTLWRYREVLPIGPDQQPVTLGEGMTPLPRAPRLEEALGMRTIYIKDESLNPTNSFKARGLSVAVTKAKYLGATTLSVPSAGNAANAMAAYCAQAGLAAKVFMPRDVKKPFVWESELYGADVTLVDGLITDAGRVAAEQGSPLGWYDVSTLKEPYRVEGKKTLAYEIGEQLGWRWPDWFIYPTGGGTGIIGMWKAFSELEQLGWVSGSSRPKMVSVQAEGCAPIVRAFETGTERAEPWSPASTVADGLRVPASRRRLPDPAGDSRKRRDGARRWRRADGKGHAGTGSPRGDQCGTRGRRHALRASGPAATRGDSSGRERRALQYGRRAQVSRATRLVW